MAELTLNEWRDQYSPSERAFFYQSLAQGAMLMPSNMTEHQLSLIGYGFHRDTEAWDATEGTDLDMTGWPELTYEMLRDEYDGMTEGTIGWEASRIIGEMDQVENEPVFDIGLQVLASAGVASLYRGSFAAGARFGFGSPAQRALNSARIDAQVGASVAGRQASRLLVDPIAVQNSRFLTTAQALRLLPSTLYEHTVKSGSLLRRAAAAGAVVNFTSGLAMQGPALYDFVVAQDENDLAYLDAQARALQIEEAAAMQDALPESDLAALQSIGIEFPTLSLDEASAVGDIAAVSEDSPEYPWRLWSPSSGATQTLGGQTTAIGQGTPPAASELSITEQMGLWDRQNPDARRYDEG